MRPTPSERAPKMTLPQISFTTAITTITTATTSVTSTLETATTKILQSLGENEEFYESDGDRNIMTNLTTSIASILVSTVPTPIMHLKLNDSLINSTQTLNNNYLYPCPSIQMPVGNVISMILYAIVCIIGLFGNTLVIYVVLRFSKMQTVTNMYILNLAIADECFLIGIPFLITTMHLGEWTFGKGMCKAYMISTSITQFTSSIFLFIMSADRYIAVCHPISSPNFRTSLISKVVCGIAWIASALMMLPVLLYADAVYKEENKMSCVIQWPHNDNDSGSKFTLYSLIFGFAIPLSLILSFYYSVIRKLRTVGPKSRSKEKKRSHKKVTKLVLTVITVYVLCWLPYWISQVALIRTPPEICQSRLEVTIFVLVGCLAYSNSAMNPILYAFLSDNFKKSFLKACTCATGKDINAQLQIENSFFPKFGKSRSGSDRFIINSRSKENIKRMTTNESATNFDTMTVTAKNSNVSSSFKLEKPPVLHTDL